VRKRKTTYPVARTATKPAPAAGAGAEPAYVRQTVVAIDATAITGRPNLKVGDHVRILGTGLYAGQGAVIEKLIVGVIPSAFVRTEAGGTRRARTIDLEPIREPIKEN